ncbi:hypothetical protein [Geodermatophilus sp. CPCC 206100]|uniref:hypothetical protein n=1 Tax=Geodermatophilus sp. CPCC 206100 TaxID=3020054 RepID=UPI003B00C047
MNASAARLSHPRRETLTPRAFDSPPITGTGVPPDTERCPDLLPGTDIRCQEALHADHVACHSAGLREGFFFTAFWWRLPTPDSAPDPAPTSGDVRPVPR